MEALVFPIALAVIVGPMLWPRGIVVKSVEPMFGGTLTNYERVSGLKAVRHWWNGELSRGGVIDGIDFDAPGGPKVVDRDGPANVVVSSYTSRE